MGNYCAHGAPDMKLQVAENAKIIEKHIEPVFRMNYPQQVRKVFWVRLGTFEKLMCSKFVGLRARLYGLHAAEWLGDFREEMPDEIIPLFLQSDSDAALAAAEP